MRILNDYLFIASSPGEAGPSTVFQSHLLPPEIEVTSVLTPQGYNIEIAIPTAYLNERQKSGWQGFAQVL